jgi:hypothetical protein
LYGQKIQNKMKRFSIFLFSAVITANAYSQVTEWRNFNTKNHSMAFNLGLIQPLLLKGANIELDYRYNHLVVGYSHGWGLDLAGNTITSDMKRQNISIHIPYTTGIGIGGSYGITKANLIIDARLEAKFHRYEVVYGSDHDSVTNKIAEYNTFTLGGGLYITYLPFAKTNNLAKGLNISMSFRYWPKISTSLKENEINYFNKYTNQDEIHQAANIGMANTPFIFNVLVMCLNPENNLRKDFASELTLR